MAPHNGLIHAKEYDIEDSNVELIGSDLDHRVKYASAASEPAWNNGVIGRQPGLFVWRIEDFAVVPVPARDVGIFYDGDSYVLLNSYRVGKEDGNDRLAHDIFFWLGAHTSQDEAGTAAYKTVELDEFLQGAATQHRELQASPSDAFLALFPQRLTIRRGGVASGFRHVDETVEEERAQRAGPTSSPTLLRIFKQPGGGAGGILIHEVEPSWRSLDDGDVFVLDTGTELYIWQGRHCSPMEKAKAAVVAQDMLSPAHTDGVQVVAQQESRSGRVVRLLGGDSDAAIGEVALKSSRPVVGDTRDSTLAATHRRRPQRLWRLSDASGMLSFDLVKDSESASLADLDSNDVFLWDDAGREIWVWQGRDASAAERSQWLRVVQAYVQHLNQEDGNADNSAHLTPVAKVREGYESQGFLRSLQAVH